MREEILDRYIELAMSVQSRENFDKATIYIEKAMLLDADSYKIRKALQFMENSLN